MKLLVAFLCGAVGATVVALVVLAPQAPQAEPPPGETAPAVAEVAEPAPPPVLPAAEPPAPPQVIRVERPVFRFPATTTPLPASPATDFAAPPAIAADSWAPVQQGWMVSTEQLRVPAPEPNRVTLGSGTLLTVRLVDTVTSERHRVGDTFFATLDQPLVADGFVIAERGADVEGRVVAIEQSGRVSGKALIAIELVRLETSDGQSVELHTQAFEREAASERSEEARKIGMGASLGALIGAIAGGGKGAAIGAAIGGGASTGAVLATKGQPAVLESETRITFRLNDPVTIVEKI